MNYKNCWLTLNRACNLRCKWCYAKGTEFQKKDDMDLNMAYDIIDVCNDLDIKNITLIGGEPTIYPFLFDVIKYAHSWGISCGIVSNGLQYANNEFLNKLIALKIKMVSISLKGENRETFKNVTGVDAFDNVIESIRMCKQNNVKVSVSMVLTEENIYTYLEGIKKVVSAGADNIHLSFCYEFDNSQYHKQKTSILDPKKIVSGFMTGYEKLCEITGGRFELFQSFPLCIWNSDDIKKLVHRKQISTVCQLLRKSGLIFDSKGNVIPCNAMPTIKLGKIYEDFNTAKELIEYIKQPDIQEVYKTLCGVPNKKCLICEDYVNCGGGCVCQWTNYSFDELMTTNGKN